MRSLDSITFAVEDFLYQGDWDNERVWHTKDGDGIGLYYFPIPPDIEADVESIEDLRAVARERARQFGHGIIEVETLTVDGCRALRKIIKVPREPHGTTYLGSLIFPFRDFSYVIKVQCHERGVTGLRDSEILDEMLDNGEIVIDDATPQGAIPNWSLDPYDPLIETPVSMNRSELEQYDARFPDHPLSKVRRLLNHIQNTVQVSDEVSHESPFVYPRPGPHKSWWKFW